MSELIAPCGIDCGACTAYKATVAGDREALAAIARRQSEQRGSEVAVEEVMCEGCVGGGERRIAFTRECPIRACALERGFANCGLCPDFACAKTNFILDRNAEARARLEKIHDRK